MLSIKSKIKILKIISKEYPYSYKQIDRIFHDVHELFDITISCMDMAIASNRDVDEIVYEIKKKLKDK